MTGIIACISSEAGEREAFAKMSRAIKRYPHDDWGEWSQNGAHLGAAMLHTTAQSRDALQPHCSDDNALALVLDGYLANYEELRSDLVARGADLRDSSDGELALRAYEQWGSDFVSRLDGEFALILADMRKREVLFARDPFGLRPLYFAQDAGRLFISSSISAIIGALPDRPAPNRAFLAELMAARLSSASQTAWQGIERVPPASRLIWAGGKLNKSTYYSLPVEADRPRRSDEDYIEEYGEVIRDAVRRASRSDAPLAVEVSGGLDSSSVFALAHGLHNQGMLAAPSLNAYALRGEVGTDADEIAFARAVAARCGAPLIEAPLYQPDLDWYQRQAASERDVPTYPNGVQSLGLTQEMLAGGSRVVLHGNGGDQWLDGTRGYIDQSVRDLEPLRWLGYMQSEVSQHGLLNGLPPFLRRSAMAAMPSSIRARLRKIRLYREEAGSGFLSQEWTNHVARAAQAFDATLPQDAVARSKLTAFHSPWTLLGNDLMAREDMRMGIESRAPLSSRRFVEFACRLPEDLKLRAGERRWIHREAMRGILPEEVRTRTDKAIFPVTYAEDEAASRLAGGLQDPVPEFLDRKQFHEFLEAFKDGKANLDQGFEFWGVLAVNMFLLENLPVEG